jgi:hypothetical protein
MMLHFVGTRRICLGSGTLWRVGLKLRFVEFLGGGPNDDKEIEILGRLIQWGKDGIRYQADLKHGRLILEHFGLGEGSRSLKSNGEKEVEDKWEGKEDLDLGETTVFRGLAARSTSSFPSHLSSTSFSPLDFKDLDPSPRPKCSKISRPCFRSA